MRIKRSAEEPNGGRESERVRTAAGGARWSSCVEVDGDVALLGVTPTGRDETGRAMPALLRDLVGNANGGAMRAWSERRRRRWGR